MLNKASAMSLLGVIEVDSTGFSTCWIVVLNAITDSLSWLLRLRKSKDLNYCQLKSWTSSYSSPNDPSETNSNTEIISGFCLFSSNKINTENLKNIFQP